MRRLRKAVGTLLPMGLALGAWMLCAAPSAGQSPKAQEAMDKANVAIQRGDFQVAIAELKKATKQDPACFQCQFWLARAYNRTASFKHGAAAARKAIDAAGSDTERAAAWNQVGAAAYANGGADAKGLEAAEEAFRQALTFDPGSGNAVRFSLGVVMLKREKDEDGKALLEEFLKHDPPAADAETARKLIADPQRARVDLVPDFTMTTLTGDKLVAQDLRGKVVLLVFWGTWSPPSYASIPFLKGQAKRSAKDPLVVVSISTDADQAALRKFVADNAMSWPQVWDHDHSISSSFAIQTYPTFIVFDGKGNIALRSEGWFEETAAELASAIARSLRALRQEG